MRTVLVTAATALLVAGTACAATGAGDVKPALRVRSAVVHGSHFRGREVVRISVVRAGERTQKLVQASSSGTFVMALRPQGKCTGTVTVLARGSSGDTARLVLRQPACGPLP